MSWDETLFGWIYRSVRAAVREPETPEAVARRAELDAVSARLALVATALAGAKITVRAAEDVGGATREEHSLPRSVSLAPDRESNARVYLHRVVCGVAATQAGMALPRALGAEEALVATALAMPAVWRRASELGPGFETLRAEVAAWELAARPALASLTVREAAIEALVRARLGAETSGLDPEAERWARMACEAPARTVEEVTRAAEALCRMLPRGRGTARMVVSWGLLRPEAPARKDGAVRKDAAPASALPGGTERRGKDREAVRRVEMARDRTDENPLTHSFEKVHTAEEYKGGRKAVDGSDEMAEHGEALDELDIREVIRSTETTRSLYRADVTLDGAWGDLVDDARADGAEFRYPEWDHRARVRREGWCSVRAGRAPEKLPAERATAHVRGVLHRHRAEVRALRAEFERVEQGRAWRDRQPDGPDVDIDALVDRHACLVARRSPPDRLYVSRRRHAPDVAALILLDASLSTDAWVAGRRVLDVARDSVIVLGEALAGVYDEVGVAAFHSNTRRDCRFAVVKAANEPWPRAWRRLMSIEPAGYTRIGPALRHATATLERARSRRRLVLLVSDGRPTDYDRYEGRYGVEDVAAAVREARDARVGVFALAVDARSRGHFTEMFGRGQYAVLPRPEALAGSMASALGRVMAG
jgi:nitric oxide reductase activation protein